VTSDDLKLEATMSAAAFARDATRAPVKYGDALVKRRARDFAELEIDV